MGVYQNPKKNNNNNNNTQVSTVDSMKNILGGIDIKKQFKSILKDKSAGFMVSLLNLYEKDLSKCEPMSVINSALVAASLDLPIDKNLGFAWIVPYKRGKDGLMTAQFQIGYKGLIQLALRTAQYKKLNAIMVYEENFKSWNPLTEEFELDLTKEPDTMRDPVGFVAYFKLLNGFEKTVYWSIEQAEKHAKKYSKSYESDREGAIWNTNPNEMHLKTVLRNMLNKYGILSIQMQNALVADQAEIKKITPINNDANLIIDTNYIDNPDEEEKNGDVTAEDVGFNSANKF